MLLSGLLVFDQNPVHRQTAQWKPRQLHWALRRVSAVRPVQDAPGMVLAKERQRLRPALRKRFASPLLLRCCPVWPEKDDILQESEPFVVRADGAVLGVVVQPVARQLHH